MTPMLLAFFPLEVIVRSNNMFQPAPENRQGSNVLIVISDDESTTNIMILLRYSGSYFMSQIFDSIVRWIGKRSDRSYGC